VALYGFAWRSGVADVANGGRRLPGSIAENFVTGGGFGQLGLLGGRCRAGSTSSVGLIVRSSTARCWWQRKAWNSKWLRCQVIPILQIQLHAMI
jgi:hypothetical protein